MSKHLFLRPLALGILFVVAFAAGLASTAPVQAQVSAPPPTLGLEIQAGPPGTGYRHLYGHVQAYRQRFAGIHFDNTSQMTYNGGPVVPSVAAYLIFWDPSNTMDTTDAQFRTLVTRYFQDIGGSNFYNVNTQYYEASPNTPYYVSSTSTLGGAYHDTTHALPGGRGSGANPITDVDIQAEVATAITANGWPNGGLGNQYFVFTAKGVESCATSTQCTIGTASPVYCAYHSSFTNGAATVLYANMPYQGTWKSGFLYSCGFFNPTPNDEDADLEISTASHEHFETSTDPFGTAWYDSTGAEIGDKCGYFYGTPAADGSNVTLNGHKYIAQLEWSNATGTGAANSGCSNSFVVDAGAAKTGDAAVNPGSNLTYHLTATNGGPNAAHGVTLRDTLPSNTTFVSFAQNTGATFTCALPTVGAAGTVNCALDTLANGGSATFTLVVNVNGATPGGTNIVNTATVSESAADANSTNNTASWTTSVNTSGTTPQVTTQPTNQAVCSGTNVSFTSAASGSPAPTVQWQVSTNGGVTFTNIAGATSGTYSFAAQSTDNGKQFHAVFTNTGGTATSNAATLTVNTAPAMTTQPTSQTVAAGSSVAFTAAASGSPAPTVQWQVSTNGGATFTNIAGATSTTYSFTAQSTDNGKQFRAVFTNTCGSATSNAATLSVNTTPVSADLSITKTAPGSVGAGQSLTYQITVGNGGPNAAQSVVMNEATPANTTFRSLSAPSGWACTNPAVGSTGSVQCASTTMNNGQTANFTFGVAVNANTPTGTVLSNTASVSSATADPNPGNNRVTANTNVVVQADMGVSQTDALSNQRRDITYTIKVKNNGPASAASVTLSDPLDSHTTLVSASSTVGSCTGTTTISCNLGTMAAGATATITIHVTVTQSTTSVRNKVTVSSTTPDPVSSNNTSTITVRLR